MSVDYRAGIAYGYKVSFDEHCEMNEKSFYEYEDDFICVNSYVYNSDYILGMWVKTLPDGTCAPLDLWEIADTLPKNYKDTLNEMLEAMGRTDLSQQKPQIYLIHQVN